jgi:hypothetical protein
MEDAKHNSKERKRQGIRIKARNGRTTTIESAETTWKTKFTIAIRYTAFEFASFDGCNAGKTAAEGVTQLVAMRSGIRCSAGAVDEFLRRV